MIISKALIQIREEQKSFAKKHLAEFLNISVVTLNKWIKTGRVSAPTGFNNKFLKNDIYHILKELDYTPQIELPTRQKKIWKELKNSKLEVIGGGLFLCSPQVTRKSNISTLADIKKYGLWRAQGMNNHEHMDTLVKNPVTQLFLAQEIIDIWIKQLQQLRPKGNIVIYWNGKVNSTLCIYLMEQFDETYLIKFDQYLNMKNFIVTDVVLP